jgi:hypothetical protein
MKKNRSESENKWMMCMCIQSLSFRCIYFIGCEDGRPYRELYFSLIVFGNNQLSLSLSLPTFFFGNNSLFAWSLLLRYYKEQLMNYQLQYMPKKFV